MRGMPLDLNAIAPAARARQIKLGQSFSSQDTLDQANQTLAALVEHGQTLSTYGSWPGIPSSSRTHVTS
jgi:hypothetical protein